MNDLGAPPVAAQQPHTFTHLDHTFSDPYHWLEDKDDPAVIAYLEAENAYAKAALAHTADLQEAMVQEMFGRMAQDDSSAPETHGGYRYYTRVEAGKQYRLFCRQPVGGGPEAILIDENALAEGHDYCRVFRSEASPDQRYFAYAVDLTGAWVFDLFVKDLHSGEIVAGPIADTAWTFAWSADSRAIFYTLFDPAHRSYKILRHALGAGSEDTLMLHESDDSFTLDVEGTRSGAYLIATSTSHSASEVRILPADQPTGEFRLFAPRRPHIEYYVDHHGDRFIIRTNEDAVNFRLMTAPLDQTDPAGWREVIPHRPDVLVEGVDPFAGHLVVYERAGGLHQLRLSNPDAVSNVRYVSFPEPVYAVIRARNLEFATDLLRFTFSSFTTPESSIDYDMARGTWIVVKQQQIPSGYDATLYQSERLTVTAADGAQIPLSLVYHKDRRTGGPQPLVLYGYGSYGYSTEVTFNANRLSLLDRGFIWASAHVRGGSELGRPWYEGGRLMNKMNTFTDFIACAEHLIAAGTTRPALLAIMGGSAGGLLVSAVANLRPDLLGAVVALVPFTNVVTAMLRPDLPLTVTEYEQWGHPDNPEAFAYFASYSPYDQIEAKPYPPMYVRAGLHDLQVPYWDPAKYVARLRALKADSNPLLLVTKMGAGHSGSSGRYDQLGDTAEIYAFLVDTLDR
ncbi:MAG: S9 family peptidase [Anaerolineae bacterium]|nr:S9 family peptidase [Anaerolineae bacterium]